MCKSRSWAKYVLLLLCSIVHPDFYLSAFSSSDTLDIQYKLPEINVSALRLTDGIKNKVFIDNRVDAVPVVWESMPLFFIESSNVFNSSFKGGSTLNTVLLNGLPSAHTKFNYAGLVLNHEMNGSFDLGLYKYLKFDYLNVIKIAPSSYLSSTGAGGQMIGGLSNYSESLEIENNTTIDRYGLFYSNINMKSKVDNKTKIELNLYSAVDDNNSPYTKKEYDNKTKRIVENKYYREDSKEVNKGVQFKLSKLFGNSYLTSDVLFIDRHIEVPNSIYAMGTIASQDDKVFAFINNYYKEFNKHFSSKTNVSYSYKELNYYQGKASIDSKSTVNYLQFESSLRYHLKNNVWAVKYGYNHIGVQSADYESSESNRGRFFIGVDYKHDLTKALNSIISYKYDLVSVTKKSFNSFSIVLNQQLGSSVLMSLNADRSFKQPTMNDLYWIPGGNKSLENETSYKVQLGLMIRSKSIFESLRINGYFIDLDNAIRWFPKNNIWSAQNVDHITSHGLNAEIHLNYQYSKFKSTLLINAEYIHSMYKNRDTEQAKVPYVSDYRFLSTYKMSYKTVGISTSFRYQSSYLEANQENKQDARSIIDVSSFIKLFRYKGIHISPSIMISNILNKQFSYSYGFPAEGRSYTINLKVNFLKI